MCRLLRRSELKSLGLGFSLAGDDGFQVGEVLFKSLVERLQKNPGQETNRIRGTKIEWALPDAVNSFFQKPSHVSVALQWNPREIAVRSLPTTVSLPSLSAKLGQFLGMRMKKAQAPFHGGRLACTASLRPSLTLFPGLLFQGFVCLKLDGGTLLGLYDR